MNLWFTIVMIIHSIRGAWAARNAYTGRHSVRAVGTLYARPASKLVLRLRHERDQRIFQPIHDDTLTVMLVA